MPGNDQRKGERASIISHGRYISSGGSGWTTVLRKILWLDSSSVGKRAGTHFHEQERGRDVVEL